ncbi:MAG TPA: heme exporter protein CcmD [Sphingomicrobium sp.]|nr:heme exporter protein CcmD [Sphingomicrobium sp.]
MNPWPFVIAAYAVSLLATAVLLVLSFASMRRAEAETDKLQRDDG